MVDTAARTDAFGLLGTLVSGRFRVDEQIAEGGFAVVYRAAQLTLDRPVALKVLKTPAGYDDAARAEFRAKFEAEAKTIARLKHPDMVDVYDFGVSVLPSGELSPWMALEWVEGETLETRIERMRGEGRRLEPREALELLRPAIQALAFAHRQGIVHRDVKPANIMITEGDHGRRVRVLDFGIAKITQGEEPAGSGRTRTGSVPAFSPAYAAPEQVTFSRTGPWTDVHALGLVLGELLTGVAPFGDPDASVHEQVMAAVRPTPASNGRDVGAFEAVIARALALAPGDRQRNAGELLAALDQAAGDGPAALAATRAPRTPGKLTRTAGALLALVVLSAALAASLAWRARNVAVVPPPTIVAPVAPVAPLTPAAPAVQSAQPHAPSVAPPGRRKKPIAPRAAPSSSLAPARRVDLFDDTK